MNFLLQKQGVQLSRDPPDYPRLNWRGLKHAQFVAARPQILRGCRLDDPNIDAQHPGFTSLRAAGDKIFEIGFHRSGTAAGGSRVAGRPLERKSSTTFDKLGKKILCEGVGEPLLVGIASQIAQRCDTYRNS